MQFGLRPIRGIANSVCILRSYNSNTWPKSITLAIFRFEQNQFTRDVIWQTVRKIGVEEWLVKFAQSVYRNAQS